MEARNYKKMNFKRIYSQIAKYGRTIPELAEEYGLDEQAFIERIERGLDPKLFSGALKANERNLKQQRNCSEELTPITIEENHKEEEDMARKNEMRMEQNYRQQQSNKDKAAQMQRKQASRKSASVSENMMDVLEKRKGIITDEISDKEKNLDEATQILTIREETVIETQRVFEKARKALNEAKSERDKAKSAVAEYTQAISKLKATLGDVENQITELKNKAIYLVAPDYTGEKPAFGTYYSTTKVEGYDTISVVEAAVEYAIEPELKDMVVAGYDSYKEYMEGLRFVMLCVEYTCKDIEYTVLVSDERLKRLLQAHIG